MGATEEQMQLLENAGVMHVSYILILFSIAFILFLCKFYSLSFIPGTCLTGSVTNVLLHIYAVHAWPESAQVQDTDPEQDGRPKPGMNGHVRTPSEARHIHDAEAFELQGLISDEEEEARAAAGQKAEGEETR